MAQKKDNENDNLKDFFSHDGDFDNMIEEKIKGWVKDQKPQEIIDSLQSQVKPITDKKAADKTQKLVNAELDSQSSGNIPETTDNTPQEKSSDAPDAKEIIAEIANPTISDKVDREWKPVSEQDEEFLKKRAEETLRTDPDFTRAILEGKVERTVIHGIQTGPWANRKVETEIVSGEIALQNIGQHKISEVWQRAANSAAASRGNVDKIKEHIKLLQLAASNIEYYKHTFMEELKRIIREGDAVERAKAETEFSRIMREKANRPHDDSGTVKPPKTPRASKTNGEAKSEKLGIKEMQALDLFLTLTRDYEMIIGMIKKKGDVSKLDAKVAYIKKALGLE